MVMMKLGIGMVTKLEVETGTFNGECKCFCILVATFIWSEPKVSESDDG